METALLVAVGIVVGLIVAGLAVFIARPRTPAPEAAAPQVAEERVVELSARVDAMGELLARAQMQLQSTVSERLDAVTAQVGVSMQNATERATENLQRLTERLVVIDHAQKNITDLASQVTSLQSVLANKQSRGAFGQGRMEVIVQDGLAKDCYEFQYTLSNKSRPDCCIRMPDGRRLVVDAKFPLESVTAFREAKNEDDRANAARQLRTDIGKHISDIAEKYLIPGETQELALMFVPSESVYAEMYDAFDDIFQKAFRSKVVIVSPSLLMLAIHVIQQIQKDARMREAADQIHAEVGHLMDDLGRLGERVRKLQGHFNQSNEDVRQILISLEKIEKRGDRIRDAEFTGDGEPDTSNVIAAPLRKIEASE